MSIKSISTPMKILELLDNRFNMPRPKNPSKQQKAKFHSTRMMPIHARIFKLLTAWVNYYPEDFILDTDFQNRVLELTHKWCETNHLLKPNYDHLIKLLEKKVLISSFAPLSFPYNGSSLFHTDITTTPLSFPFLPF